MRHRNHIQQSDRRVAAQARRAAKRHHDAEHVRAHLDYLTGEEGLDERIRNEREEGRTRGAAVAVAVLAVVQIAIVSSLSWYPSIARQLHLQPHPGAWPYLVAAACFIPLMLPRRMAVLRLVLTSALTGLYLAMQWPPSIVILAPMSALFTVAERYGGRRAWPLGVGLGGIVLAVSALSVSVSYTVAEVIAILALLGLAAALGHGMQQRRELFDEVRRKRHEEGLRRIEEERLRIARDVHDIMAHSLTLMTVQADAGLASASDAEKSAAAFTVIGDTGRATLRDLREMLAVLSGDAGEDSPRDPLGELGQLETLVRPLRETGLEVTLETAGDLDAVPSAVAVSAYRIVQEALTNVVRHANATHVRVGVAATERELTLQILDDGAGGDPPVEGAGRGILGMRERVAVLGGTITAQPAEEDGFEVRATIPLTRGKRCPSA